MDDASRAQTIAADPAASTWLSANAGSGKTRVLIDRVARLLLGGTEPQRILCLTYTKAAAAEMQNRLFERLGAWAMMPEADLGLALAQLDPEGPPITPERLSAARRLFARAIETPGGLKIQTIHSFCGGILRRFPLEAGVSPQFGEMDDRMTRLLRDEIVEDMADRLAPEVVKAVAALSRDEDFDKIATEIARNRSAFAARHSPETVRAALGIGPGISRASILEQCFLGDEPLWMGQVISAMRGGKVTDVKHAESLARLDFAAPSLALLDACIEIFLTKSGNAPFTAKVGAIPTKDIATALGATKDKLDYLMQRVEVARADLVMLRAAERSIALHDFAAVFLPEYERRKLARGWLDFDDLILRARDLLSDSALAQWVLFRLDGGIDHILVDEAQDTGPEQWRVIELLTQEFTAGKGARDTVRTVFVVGDKKQSIYSFQGADLEKFDEMQGHFSHRLRDIAQEMRKLELLYSFRSSPAILKAVDHVLATSAPMGPVRHMAFQDQMPGRVDLWPVTPEDPAPKDPEWYMPVDALPPRAATVLLAEAIAAEIERMVESGTRIMHKGKPRRMRYGDVLVLVQKRSVMFQEVIRACKGRNLPIAGADRLKLGAELAVKDLTALMSFLATPEDDLSLAAVLRSPVFGWTEAQLFALAQPRPKGVWLWEALRDDPAHAATTEVLRDLQKVSDYLRPFELIDRLLTRHDARRRLIARLGPEAEDGIDQFLALAMGYERLEVPSLTGFLTWLGAEEVEVKRQSDAASDRIRVMTVHGAKGLEAPVVILPDTADRKKPESGPLVMIGNGVPVWKAASGQTPAVVEAALTHEADRRFAENDRLLYVAMTRAESWLIVAAAGKTDTSECWYNKISTGLQAAGARSLATPQGPGLRLEHGVWPDNDPAPRAQTPDSAVPLPAWAAIRLPQPPRPVAALNPSDLGGAKALPGEETEPESEVAMARGSALHRLLEVLPALPSQDWPELARSLVPDWADDVLPEAAAVISDAELAPLFAPGTLAEVEIRTRLAGQEMIGTIDRLIVAPEHLLVVDYKSNRIVPAHPGEIPEGLLRQMAAYRLALGPVYPGRRIDCALLWTRNARLMAIPGDMLDAAASRAGLTPDIP